MEPSRTCCVFGHRMIAANEKLKSWAYEVVESLIVRENVDHFLFGSKSQFCDFCLEVVTKLKEKYPQVKQIYVRAEYPYPDERYQNYLLKRFDDTYIPKGVLDAGRAVYVKRNFEMIDNSKFCIVYYDEKNAPVTRKSGTKIALDYAVKKGKTIAQFPL